MPTFTRRPSTMCSLLRWILRRILWLDSEDSKYRSCKSTFLCWNIRFKNQVTTCSDFHRKQCCGSKKWRWSIRWVSLSLRDQLLERIFQILRDARCESCFCSEQDHPEFPIQEEDQSRGTESPGGGPVSMRKTDRFHDLRPLSSGWRS